jgi:cation diffusion facilitator family transporter
MAVEKKHRINGDLSERILLILLKKGALSLKEIQEHTTLQTLDFHDRHESQRGKTKKITDVSETCEGMVCKGWLKLDDAKYTLTDSGKAQAEVTAKAMKKGADFLEKQVLTSSATARNTIGGYTFLSVLKLIVGFFSGSVGLIADGADTTVDTAAASIVWGGIKFKKEVVGTIAIIGLMFVTAVILFYDSAVSIWENVAGTFLPMAHPIYVIIVEAVAMLTVFVLSLYQRFVGRRNKSLSLISQSIDSKNSVYSAGAVIVGAVCSIFGVFWVDALVGGFIAVRISLDGFGLTREVVSMMRGKQPDYSQFKLPFEKQIEQRRIEMFGNWIMYSIQTDKLSSKEQIVASLEKTFRPSYMPEIFAEFTVGKMFDFQNNFDLIVNPLISQAYMQQADGAFALTDKGKSYLKGVMGTLRYRETEL